MATTRAARNPSLMGSSSLLIVIITALITWIVATFVLSHQQHIDIINKLAPLGQFSPTSKHAAASNHHHEDAATMQGGKVSFKKKMRSYINMTNYGGPSTTWKVYPHKFPCVPGESKHLLSTPAHEGILFQRPVKTGSTTLTAIILRFVQRYASSASSSICKYRAMHATSRELDFVNRKREQSYLLSVIRDPTLKAISRYFHFDVSIGQKVPVDEHFQMIMRRTYNKNDLTQQLTTRPRPNIPVSDATKIVQEILDDYDFIAVTERMDESLVAWKMLLNLDFYDMLYITARSSGTFSNGPVQKGRPCVYLMPSFLTPGMQDFFESKEWKDSNAIDIMLYQAVNQSLDNTIASLGKKRFQEEFETFKQAQQLAQEYCQGKVFGYCSPGGTVVPEKERTCVLWGEGCDYDCLTNFRKEGGLNELLKSRQVKE